MNEYQEPPFHPAHSCAFIRRWSVWVVPCRYTHDSSETLEDRLDLTATDGTNPVDFTLQVQVGRSSLRFKPKEEPHLDIKPPLVCVRGLPLQVKHVLLHASPSPLIG